MDPQRLTSEKSGELRKFYRLEAGRDAWLFIPDEMPPSWSFPIGTRLIQAMHKTLMTGVRGQDKSPGRYREIQVQIGATGRYVPPPRHEISRLMGNLERFARTAPDNYDPLVTCYLAHYQFEAIHPFVDGNGRVGRALLALMVYHKLAHSMPWLYMSAFFERHKDEYTDNLMRISTHGDWDRWIEFCLHGTVVQSRDAIARCHRFNQARKNFHEMCANPTPRSHDIIEGLFDTPVVTIPDLKRRFGVHYQTAQKDVEKLVELEILQDIPDKYPRSLYSPELMRIAYSNSIEEIDAGSSGWDV